MKLEFKSESAIRSDVKKRVEENRAELEGLIDFQELTQFQKIVLNPIIMLAIIISSVGIMIFSAAWFITINPKASGIISLIAIFILVTWLVMFFIVRRNARGNNHFDSSRIYNILLNKMYDNIEISGASQELPKSIYSLRPARVPQDADLFKIFQGHSGTINSKKFETWFVIYVWYRQTNSKNGMRTETFYGYKNIGLITEFNDRFNKTAFDMFYHRKGNKRSIDLENEMFNHSCRLFSNDKVGIRRIFTPKIQDDFVKNNRKVKTTEIHLGKQEVSVFVESMANPYQLSIREFRSREKFIKAVLKEAINDVTEFFSVLNHVTLLKNMA